MPITKGFPIDLHYQTVSEPAVISRLLSIQSKSNGEVLKLKPRCLNKNQVHTDGSKGIISRFSMLIIRAGYPNYDKLTIHP